MALRPEVLALEQELIENRRWFHEHPELSFREFKTAEKVVAHLRSYGITELWEGVGRTGVVAVIRGGLVGPCIALRADMDALPLEETADVPYRSVNPGVMHACGHDGHIACLLTVARVLADRRATLRGAVKLIFQPAEEDTGGAEGMIAAGCLSDTMGPQVDLIFGLHLWSYNAVGTCACDHGAVMASCDDFSITVGGRGGHGAAPAGTVDAIVEAAHLVTALQTIVSRNVDPVDAAILSCGQISGGHAPNIIADRVEIRGTSRAFLPATQERVYTRMREVCAGVAATFGGDISFEYTRGHPPTINASASAVSTVRRAAARVVGDGNEALPQRTCAAEDFSCFLQRVPGAFFFVGAALPGPQRPHHKSVFDFDERALGVAASVLLNVVDDVLGGDT